MKIQKKSLQLENSNLYGGIKETTSTSKNRLQKICNDLDKHLNNQIRDLNVIEHLFRELIKILEAFKDADYIILRQLKFVTLVVEIFKKVVGCRKNEYSHYLTLIGMVTQILYQFCSLYDNRTYLIVSNKLIPIIDFLYSFLQSKPTKYIYG